MVADRRISSFLRRRLPPRLVLVFVLAGPLACVGAGSAEAVTVYNESVFEAPYGYEWDDGYTMGPAAGWGFSHCDHFQSTMLGESYTYTNVYAYANWVGWNIGRAEAQSALGETEIYCARDGNYHATARVSLDGMAGLYIPVAATGLGLLNAQCDVELQVNVVDITNPSLPLGMINYVYPLLHADDDYTAAADVWTWDEVLDLTTPSAYFFAGRNYRASVCLKIFSRVEARNTDKTGQSIAVFKYFDFNFGGQHYIVDGHAAVREIRVVNDDPDHTPPTTVFEPGLWIDPLDTCAGIIQGKLVSHDNAGGYGLDTVYWRYPGGSWQIYNTNDVFQRWFDDLSLEFYATDIVGNVEPVRSFVYDFIPTAPVALAPPHGGSPLLQPVLLQWTRRDGYSSEYVRVSDNPDMLSAVFEQTAPGTNALVAGLAPGTYYWRAHSYHDDCTNWGPWTGVREFTVTGAELSAAGAGDDDWGPYDVPYPNRGFVGVAAGSDHSLLIRDDGSVEAMGRNIHGACDVPEPNTGFVAVAGGAHHSLGLKADGTLVPWGGLLDVPPPNADFVAIACGVSHDLALRQDGSLAAWGSNVDGQCDVPAPNSGFVAVDGGSQHSVGLKQDGTLALWGGNTYGQLDLPGPNTDFVAIAAGSYHTLGLKTDGTLVAWGFDNEGQCGLPDPNTGFVAVWAGGCNSAALRDDGSLVTWGSDEFGQLIDTEPTDYWAIAFGDCHHVALREWDGVSATEPAEDLDLPRNLGIAGATPNPFNPRTTIWLDVPQRTALALRIYDLRGRLVRTLREGDCASGTHGVTWDGRDAVGTAVPTGVYLARLTPADAGKGTFKLLLVK